MSFAQEWISASDFEHPWQVFGSSPWYIPLLCLRNDEAMPYATTPMMLVSLSLCYSSHFFDVAFSIFPSLHFYIDSFYRLNSEALSHRFAHCITFMQKGAFLKNGVGILEDYPVKIFYVQGDITEQLVAAIGSLRRKPIVICHVDYKPLFSEKRCPALSFEETNAVNLNAAIESLARSAPDILNLVHTDPQYTEPLVSVDQDPSRYRFHGSGMRAVPLHNALLLKPNEYLANHIRRALPPNQATSHTRETRLSLLIESQQLIDLEHSIDTLLTARSDGAEGIPAEYHEDLDKVLQRQDADAYERLLATRANNGRVRTHRLILCVPCVNKVIPTTIFNRKLPDRVFRHLFQGRSTDYNLYFEENRFRNAEEMQMAMTLSQIQGVEMEYLTNILTLMALAERAPVYRVPQVGSSFFGLLRELRRRHEERNIVGLNRGITKFGTDLADAIPKEIVTQLAAIKPASVRIVSDIPVEWLHIDGIPLMYSSQVSRIPATPGNFLLTHYNQVLNDIYLDANSAKRLLIVNCLGPDDQLYRYPQILRELLNEQQIPHDYKAINNLHDYRRTLDEYRPFILLHFGHGTYDKRTDVGYLHIANEATKVWDFSPGVIPPIILLGACDTAAIAETYNTPANAFLGLGARSVLGTFLPVDADRTIELYVRIMANLWDAIQGQYALETWGKVVWKTIVLNRYLDFLHAFNNEQERRRRNPAARDVVFEFTYLWGQRVTDLVEGYKSCPQILRDAIAHFDESTAKEFEIFMRRNIAAPHTMFFTHLGSPDTIQVVRSFTPTDSRWASQAYWDSRADEDSNGGSQVPADTP